MTHFEYAETAQPGGRADAISSLLLEAANSAQFTRTAIKNPIDKQADICESNSRSTADAVTCGDNAQAAWKIEMKKAYKTLQNKETFEDRLALLRAQGQFIAFMDKEFDSIDEIYKDQGVGSMGSSFAAFAKANVVKDRTIELQNRAGNNSNGSPADRINVPAGGMLYIDRLGQALDDETAALDKNYTALTAKLNPAGQEALGNSQSAWVKFQGAEFRLIDKLTDSRYPGNRVEGLEAKIDLVKNRADHLQHQLNVITEAGD